MIFKETFINGLFEIRPQVYKDHRGFFLESFHQRQFQEAGINGSFVQDNQSYSRQGVLRGLHFQRPPHQQGKLVSVVTGKVLDVVVDMRPASLTFGKHYKCILTAEEHNMLYVPGGTAHGFLALEDSLFLYKCTEFYDPKSEAGVRWDDQELGIDWGVTHPRLSEKDANLPGFQEIIKKL